MSLGKLGPEMVAHLHDLAAQHEGHFPSGFRDYNLYAEEQLASGRWPAGWATRSRRKEKGVALAQAILEELQILICQNGPKYRDVTKAGKNVAQKTIAAIAGYVAAKCGIEIALATSAVAASILLVVRVGTEAFCRAHR